MRERGRAKQLEQSGFKMLTTWSWSGFESEMSTAGVCVLNPWSPAADAIFEAVECAGGGT